MCCQCVDNLVAVEGVENAGGAEGPDAQSEVVGGANHVLAVVGEGH